MFGVTWSVVCLYFATMFTFNSVVYVCVRVRAWLRTSCLIVHSHFALCSLVHAWLPTETFHLSYCSRFIMFLSLLCISIHFISFSSTRFFILPLHTFLSFFTPHQQVSNPTIKQNHPKLTLTLWPIQAVSRQISPRKPRFIARHSMWNYKTKWAWDWFLSEHFVLTCQLFYQELATYIRP